jgi:peptidoglycan/xylan/chitin deacetylase (PgdA/CDA1 family)
MFALGAVVRLLGVLFVTGLMGAAMTGCAKPPKQTELMAQAVEPVQAFAATAYLPASVRLGQVQPQRAFAATSLSGRTLAVATTTDIILNPGEVVITFDDGPRPGKTPAILDTLDQFGVKATFLMLGTSAQAYPEIAQQVAERGHSVGSHTYDHVDLTTLSRQAAFAEIARGEQAVADALMGSGVGVAPFFRFPYLAQDGYLRAGLLGGNMVVLDVDIDSKDYYKDTPQIVAQRTLDRLEARGSGVILFHDIHQRTVDMLPEFLEEIANRGYSVVHLVPQRPGLFGRPVITANVPDDADQV